jgi:molybdopterin synthase sulfur carrier subunit
MIKVKLFASLRERVGQDQLELEDDALSTVGEVWQRIAPPELELGENVLMAVNLEYVHADHPVRAGDEVAFFPPVTGG